MMCVRFRPNTCESCGHQLVFFFFFFFFFCLMIRRPPRSTQSRSSAASDVYKRQVYQQGDFIDLCRGPHVPSTKKITAFKLLSVAGAYWRGDEKNKMLQRIYGLSLIHISEPTRLLSISYAVFCLKKKNKDRKLNTY